MVRSQLFMPRLVISSFFVMSFMVLVGVLGTGDPKTPASNTTAAWAAAKPNVAAQQSSLTPEEDTLPSYQQAKTSSTITTAATSSATVTSSNVTVIASSTNVRLQDKSTLTGVLSATDTSTDPPGPTIPLANQPIQIEETTGNGVWQTVASTTTDANGAFSAAVTVRYATAYYRVSYAGDATYPATQSQAIKITGFKATSKIYSTGPSQIKAETTTTFYARFVVYDSRVSGHPAIVGAAVDVYRKDAYGGSWKKFVTVTTNNSGTVAWRAKVSTPTYWKLTAHGTATALYAYAAAYKPRVIPIGKVFKLPSGAPKPSYLAPQPGAIGSGAHAAVSRIPDSVWKNMVGRSWHSGCPVGRSSLLYMTINYWGFDGYRHRGELVFRSSHKAEFVKAFTWMYKKHIPLHGMYRVDKFGYSSRTHGADDYASMKHDNTSAFNCRWVDGRPGVTSPHSYGTAVDINPYENPYHSAKGWTPNYWWRAHHIKPYTWRSRSDTQVYIMTHSGFRWTYGNEDSQHFDA